MNVKKINFSSELCTLREKRSYLHSTDIFNQIVLINKLNVIKNLNINFKKKICNLPFIEIYKKPANKKNKESSVNFQFKKNKKFFFGYIFENKKKIKKIKNYNEKIFRRKVKINKSKIYIPNFHDFNFIEKITSSAMKFLIKTSPEKNKKWYLAKLSIKSFSCNEKYNNLFLISEKKIDSINLFKIFKKKIFLGEMLFIKK